MGIYIVCPPDACCPQRCSGRVPLGGDPEEVPGHAMLLGWPGNASGSPQESCRKCLGVPALTVTPVTRPR